MKVYIKNKILSIGGGSEVLNEELRPIYKVKGKLISPTKKKKMYDLEGKLLFTIRNRFWNIFADKVFVYDENKEKVATIKKSKWSVNADYEIENTIDDMLIEGKIFGRTSKILKNGQPVGTIVRDFSLMNDAFTLEADEKDIAFLTAIVIAFDNINDKTKKQDV